MEVEYRKFPLEVHTPIEAHGDVVLVDAEIALEEVPHEAPVHLNVLIDITPVFHRTHLAHQLGIDVVCRKTPPIDAGVQAHTSQTVHPKEPAHIELIALQFTRIGYHPAAVVLTQGKVGAQLSYRGAQTSIGHEVADETCERTLELHQSELNKVWRNRKMVSCGEGRNGNGDQVRMVGHQSFQIEVHEGLSHVGQAVQVDVSLQVGTIAIPDVEPAAIEGTHRAVHLARYPDGLVYAR